MVEVMQRMGNPIFIFGVIVPAVLGLVAILMLLGALRQSMQASAARPWPTTTGVVVEAAVEESVDDGTTYYRPLVTYRYTVDGQTFTGDGLAFGSKRNALHGQRGQTWATNKAQAYRAGQRVPVHYHPRRPAEAVLEVRTDGARTLVLVGVFLALLGAVMFAGYVWLNRI